MILRHIFCEIDILSGHNCGRNEINGLSKNEPKNLSDYLQNIRSIENYRKYDNGNCKSLNEFPSILFESII